MTASAGSTSVDGTPISASDRARIAAEDALHLDQRRQAVRVVAAASRDVEECRMLLAMLGLDGAVVAAARTPRPAGTPAKRARKRSVAA